MKGFDTQKILKTAKTSRDILINCGKLYLTSNGIERKFYKFLYGRLKIPGRPISININNYDSFKTNGYIINSNGDISSNASITDEK